MASNEPQKITISHFNDEDTTVNILVIELSFWGALETTSAKLPMALEITF